MIQLPFSPQEAAKRLCNALPHRRMRDVLESRFGLKGRGRATLEKIGQAYKITRERVRQIEADALRRVAGPAELRAVEPLLHAIGDQLREYGGVASSEYLFSAVSDRRHHPHLHFLLFVHPAFHFMPETDILRERWALDKRTAAVADILVGHVVKKLEGNAKPVSYAELRGIAHSISEEVLHSSLPSAHVEAALATSKVLKANPYGEYGLASWPTVTPRGIKDKAYAALSHAGRPAHFREVASLIDSGGWSKKKVHPQTVHNELIKDSRFVLVGRGLYALREWGYEQGTVREVISTLLKEARTPLAREEIITLASLRRRVKPQTILLNLQNRSLFKRTDDGKYTLA